MRTLPVLSASWILAFAGLGVVACGESEISVPSDAEWAEPGVLLGNWTGVKVEQRREADPDFAVIVPDTFALEVDSEGRYAARLILTGALEEGWIRVEPPSLTFRPTNPPGPDAPGTLAELEGDTIRIVGDSNYDFGNGEEPSILTIDLVPRAGG